jgi:hypothetical protein
MNSPVHADSVASAADLEQIFARVRPMGFTPLASALEGKVLEPYYEMLRSTPAANVKPMVVYICTDGAPTTERGLKTYQPTFSMLGKVTRSAQALLCLRIAVGTRSQSLHLTFAARWNPLCRASACRARPSASTSRRLVSMTCVLTLFLKRGGCCDSEPVLQGASEFLQTLDDHPQYAALP